MEADQPELTIGIPTFGRDRVLLDTIQNVLQHLEPASMELVVADQTPSHEKSVAAELQRLHDAGNLRWIHLPEPSLTGARNVILREARAEIVLYLDDDMLIPRHLFREHLESYQEPSIGAVTGQVYNCIDYRDPPSLDDPTQKTTPHSEVKESCDAKNTSG